MMTYFASPERADNKMLEKETRAVCSSPVISGLMETVGGVLAVLNQQRQIVAVNDHFLKALGFPNPEEALGLRPGEVLDCNHSELEDGGCGTSRYCSTCGAALAIVSALNNDKPEKRICALSCTRNGKDTDVGLLVRAHPFNIDDKKFILLFLHDITVQQQRAALERTFFHDIRNILSGMMGASELINVTMDDERRISLANIIHNTSVRLSKEVEIQKYLLENESLNYQPLIDDFEYSSFIDDLKTHLSVFPAAKKKELDFQMPGSPLVLRTDYSLLMRIMTNMVINAIEASEDGEVIRILPEEKGDEFKISVWNRRAIPENVQLRIFQRNFSTKDGEGRGLGTFSMKLFGEKILGGRIEFKSSEEDGTIFSFILPPKR